MKTQICTRLNWNNVSRIRTMSFLLPRWEGLLCCYLHVSTSLSSFFFLFKLDMFCYYVSGLRFC